MDAIRRTSTLRRVATTASLAALLLTPGAADAKAKAKPKSPVITSVSPMKATVGQTLTIKGRNFRKGKGKNSVGFKRDGSAVVFVKAGVSTTKVMAVKLPARLEEVMYGEPATFHLRILSARFGKSFTAGKLSPTVSPRPADLDPDPEAPVSTPPAGTVPVTAAVPAGPPSDCDNDGVANQDDADDDNDLLTDARENEIGTDGCKADTDGDGVQDGYEYRSAIDLNDDEYQQPNSTPIYPGALPYPNPLSKDADKDYDGDGLPLAAEYDLWVKLTPAGARTLADQADKATPLNYSDGLQYSVSRRCGASEVAGLCGSGNYDEGRRVPTLTGANYDKYQNFLAWLNGSGFRIIELHDRVEWFDHNDGRHPYDILDVDRSKNTDPDTEAVALDEAGRGEGFLSDDERDEDADGLSNFDELRSRMTPEYWAACYSAEPTYAISYAATDPAKADTDGDGIRDGADDQDHDDVPNLMELSRMAASHLDDTDNKIEAPEGADPSTVSSGGGKHCKADEDLDPKVSRHPSAFGRVNPFNPCMPDRDSRSCQRHEIIGAEDGPDWWSLN